MIGHPAPLAGGESETSNHDRGFAIGEMIGSDQVPDRQITGEPFGLVMAIIFPLERNGALSCVNSKVCPKTT